MRASRREVEEAMRNAHAGTKYAIDGVWCADILRAEVLRLRRDSERLDWLLDNRDMSVQCYGKRCGVAWLESRREIDAAMTAAKKAGRKG